MKFTLGKAAVAAAALTVSVLSPASGDDAGAAAGSAAGPAVGSARSAGHAPAKTLAGAVTLGQVASPGPGFTNCVGNRATVQVTEGVAPSYEVPDAGVVTSFSLYANNPGQVRAVLLSPGATPTSKTLAGTSPLETVTPGSVNTFQVRVLAPAGARLGLFNKDTMGCLTMGTAMFDNLLFGPFDPEASTSYTGGALTQARANISAVLEPDGDHDGYGDVSQDACPQSARSQVACPAPDTTVTKRPKKTSSNRKVTIRFSSVPGATYTCKVDNKAAKACSSPFKKKLGYGKHSVVITATSPAGIVEAKPVLVKFKIVQPT